MEKRMLTYYEENITTPFINKTNMNAVMLPILGIVICGGSQK